MKNKLITIVIAIMMITLISAGVTTFILKDAVISSTAEKSGTIISPITYGNINYNCGTKKLSINLGVPRDDLLGMEFYRLTKTMVSPYYCSEIITNAVDWNGRNLKEIKGYYSFNVEDVKSKECLISGKILIKDTCKTENEIRCEKYNVPYDSKLDECIYPEVKIEPIKEPIVEGVVA